MVLNRNNPSWVLGLHKNPQPAPASLLLHKRFQGSGDVQRHQVHTVTSVELEDVLDFLLSLALCPSAAALVCRAAGLLSLLAVAQQQHSSAAAPAPAAPQRRARARGLLCQPLRPPAAPLALVIPQLHQPLVEIFLQGFVLEASIGGLVAFQAAAPQAMG